MSNSKATPGPWTIDGILESSPDKPWIIKGLRKDVPCGWVVVGSVTKAYTKKSTWQKPVYSEESKANARLIAAAPELLLACKAVLAFHERGVEKGEPRISNVFVAQLQQAIAKAEANQ